jgi:hypothetical protein
MPAALPERVQGPADSPGTEPGATGQASPCSRRVHAPLVLDRPPGACGRTL